MPSLNFMTQFAPRVADGSKPHSIRAWRKVPFKVGDDLSFFTGMRTKACRRLRANTPCVGAETIEINALHRYVILGAASIYYPRRFEGMLDPEQIEQLAKADGFGSVAEFWLFFALVHGGIARGQLIEWTP